MVSLFLYIFLSLLRRQDGGCNGLDLLTSMFITISVQALRFGVGDKILHAILESCPQSVCAYDFEGITPLHYTLEVHASLQRMPRNNVVATVHKMLNLCPGAFQLAKMDTENLNTPLMLLLGNHQHFPVSLMLKIVDAWPEAVRFSQHPHRCLP